MKRHAPEVAQYMTHLPVEAERCETVADAITLMDRHRVHHLPVMSGSKLKGVVSRAELVAAVTDASNNHDATSKLLDHLCQGEVLTVRPPTPIDDIARQFLDLETDCAVVIDGGFVVGIFTVTDLLRFVGDFFGHADP